MFGEQNPSAEVEMTPAAGSAALHAGAAPPLPKSQEYRQSATAMGDGDDGEPRAKTVEEIIESLDADQDVSGPKGGCCARLFIPVVTLALVVLLLVWTVMWSGTTAETKATPRVALFIIEGFRADVFTELTESGLHLPYLSQMLASRRGGSYAACTTPSDSHCAQAVLVEREDTSQVFVYSGSSIASILTGVTPAVHKVQDETLAAYENFARTSQTYPSLAKRVTDAGGKVLAMGNAHLLNAPRNDRCTQPGVLDMECRGTTSSTTLDCGTTSSCNLRVRRLTATTSPTSYSDGEAEALFGQALREVFGRLAFTSPSQETAHTDATADAFDDSLLIFQFDALEVRADSASLPAFTYSGSSAAYVAQAYLIDSMIGQVLTYLADRAKSQKENWLVIGTSDHGGAGKQFNVPGHGSTEEMLVVPFFVGSYTSDRKGYVHLAPMDTTVSVLDVVPTALRWLNMAPFDDATQAAIDGTNTTYSSEVDAQMAARGVFEGKVRGICSSGVQPTDCGTTA